MEFMGFDHKLSDLLHFGGKTDIAAFLLNSSQTEILNFVPLRCGMTNDSYLFEHRDCKYILRLPGVGTSELINRYEEGRVYAEISKLQISERVVAFDEKTGIKLSVFMENCRAIDPFNWDDVSICMDILHFIHNSDCNVSHEFNLRERLSFYTELYAKTNNKLTSDMQKNIATVGALLDEIEAMNIKPTLCHIDTVPDNFLVLPNSVVRLIDWEYSAMGDPLTDVAMFCLRSNFDYDDVNSTLNMYLCRNATKSEKLRCYTLMVASALLWTLWSDYKALFGADFSQYRQLMASCFEKYLQYDIFADNNFTENYIGI